MANEQPPFSTTDGHIIHDTMSQIKWFFGTGLFKKVYIPLNEYPDYSLIGLILGPGGLTIKQLERETGCNLMIRGKRQISDKNQEDLARFGHNEALHVLITVNNRAQSKLQMSVNRVTSLFPTFKDIDVFKKKQLREVKYRDSNSTTLQGPVGGVPGGQRLYIHDFQKYLRI